MVTTNGKAEKTPSKSDLNIGDRVEIHGLKGAWELNGRRGKITAFVEETQRFGVKLHGELESKAIKAANLRRLPQPGAQASSPFPSAQAPAPKATATCSAPSPCDPGDDDGTIFSMLPPLPKEQHRAAKATPPPCGIIPLLPSEQHKAVASRPAKPTPQLEKAVRKMAPAAVAAALCDPDTESRSRMAAPEADADCDPLEPLYLDEHEYPDPARAHRSKKVVLGTVVCGVIASQADLFPATWFVWTFLAVHLVGVVCLTDYDKETGLLALSALIGSHMGIALSEIVLWMLAMDGSDSLGPWSVVTFFASILYLHSFWTEYSILPPDYITSISLFFPMFPAYNAAMIFSCIEFFVEWRYLGDYKVWRSAVGAGVLLMAAGQALIFFACRTADRNFWASCRNMSEEDKPEDFVGLEIPDRRIVKERCFRWERHPAYLGAMLWGIGAEVALCNPVMLLMTGFVLWASLLYVTLEEEQELYDEFKGGYADYASLTPCWIPMFNSFLESAAFQREMSDHCCIGCDHHHHFDEEPEEDEAELDEFDEDDQSEDEMLPSLDGVRKGGALWNRQFREPWILG